MIETWRKCLDENKIVSATLMDLSKAIDCLPHDLLVAKLEAYSLDTKTLKHMLSYLSGHKQCIKIRNCFSLLKLILSDIPQGSILGPILFNIFMNDIFFLLGSDLHNFADDNNVIAVAETIQDLMNSLEVKTGNAIEWMKDNDMIANQNKFKAIVLTKTDHNTAGIKLEFSRKTILSSNEIDLLGVTIDTNSRITKICRKASRQLKAWKRVGFYIPLDTRKILANSFIISNFDYFSLVWYFLRAKQLQKIEKMQERILRFLYDDYVSDYLKLLKASVSVSMKVRRMRYLCVEIYKTLNDLNPGYMKDIFQVQQSAYSTRRSYNIKVPRVSQTTFGTRSIRNLESLTKLTQIG